MCKAMREWSTEERRIGYKENRRECKGDTRFFVVKNMLCHGIAEADIMANAEGNREFISKVVYEI